MRHLSVPTLLLLLVACGGEATEAPAEPAVAEAPAEAPAEVDEALKEVVEEKTEAAMAENLKALLEEPIEVNDAQKASCDKLTECECSEQHLNACHQAAAKMDAELVGKGKEAHGTWTKVGELACEQVCEGFLGAMENEFRDIAL